MRPRYVALTALLLFPCSVLAEWEGQKTFRFQSGFWINLHHFLFQRAVEQPADNIAAPSGLAPEQAQGWSKALSYYHEQFDGKNGQSALSAGLAPKGYCRQPRDCADSGLLACIGYRLAAPRPAVGWIRSLSLEMGQDS